MKKKTLLKNICITHISLVDAGANRRSIIYKSDTSEHSEIKQIPIRKIDEEKRMVFGVVYAPDDVDTQGDYSTASEIEAAAHRFMKEMNLHNIDRNHDFNPEGAYVAESWLIRKGDPLFPDEPDGAWAVGIKIESPELWEMVKSGKYKALSMAGAAEKQASDNMDGDEPPSWFKRFFEKWLKPKETDMNKEEVQAIIKSDLAALPKPLTEEQLAKVFKAAFVESVKPITDRLDKLEKGSGSTQDSSQITKDADLEAMGAKIAKMING